jgi:hypothetical protein
MAIVKKINFVILSMPGKALTIFSKFISNKIKSEELDKNILTINGIMLRLKNSNIVRNNKNNNKINNLNFKLIEKIFQKFLNILFMSSKIYIKSQQLFYNPSYYNDWKKNKTITKYTSI